MDKKGPYPTMSFQKDLECELCYCGFTTTMAIRHVTKLKCVVWT